MKSPWLAHFKEWVGRIDKVAIYLLEADTRENREYDPMRKILFWSETINIMTL